MPCSLLELVSSRCWFKRLRFREGKDIAWIHTADWITRRFRVQTEGQGQGNLYPELFINTYIVCEGRDATLGALCCFYAWNAECFHLVSPREPFPPNTQSVSHWGSPVSSTHETARNLTNPFVLWPQAVHIKQMGPHLRVKASILKMCYHCILSRRWVMRNKSQIVPDNIRQYIFEHPRFTNEETKAPYKEDSPNLR